MRLGSYFSMKRSPFLLRRDAAFAAHRFGDENSRTPGGQTIPVGMELHEFHIEQFGASFVGERHAVAGALPGIRGDLPGLSDAARGDDDRLRLEHDEASRFRASSRRRPTTRSPSLSRRVIVHSMKTSKPSCTPRSCSVRIISRPVRSPTWREPFVGVAAESALQNVAIFRAVEERAPLLELANPVRRFLRVKLRHAPVVQKFAAAHGVAEVGAPVVRFVHVGHRGGDAAFGHYGVRLAEQRLADNADSRALGQSFDRGSRPAPPAPMIRTSCSWVSYLAVTGVECPL